MSKLHTDLRKPETNAADIPREAGASRGKSLIVFLVALSLAVTLQVVWALVAPALPLPPLLSYLLSFAMVVGVIAATSNFCARVVDAYRPSPRFLAVVLFGAGVIYGVYRYSASPEQDVGWGAMVALLAIVAWTLLAFGSFAGAVIGSRVQSPGHLVVVAAVSSLADIYSVMSRSGISRQVIEDEFALNVVTVSWAMAGTELVLPVLGVGDIVMTAFYLAVARVHRLSIARMTLALCLGYALTCVALLVFEVALPALPFLGLAVVLVVPEARKVPAGDRKTALIGVLLSVVVVAAILVRDALQ